LAVYTFPLDEHLVVFRPRDRHLFILNPTARWIWEARARGTKTGEIASLISAQFDIPNDAVRKDVEQALSLWSAKNLEPALSIQNSDQPTSEPHHKVPARSSITPDESLLCFEGHYRFAAAGVIVRIYTSDMVPLIEPLLAGLKVKVGGTTRNNQNVIEVLLYEDQYVVACNGTEVGRTSFAHHALGKIIQALIQTGYPESEWMAYVHGAAAAFEGRGIVLPGIGGSGKSTLVAALSHCGWQYWCDDTVPFQTNGKARAVPLNICLKEGSWRALRPYCQNLEGLATHHRYGRDVKYLPLNEGQTQPAYALPVDFMVFPKYSREAPASLKRIPPAEALQRLIEAQTWVSPEPRHAAALIRWISTLAAYQITYDTLDQGVSFMNRIVCDDTV